MKLKELLSILFRHGVIMTGTSGIRFQGILNSTGGPFLLLMVLLQNSISMYGQTVYTSPPENIDQSAIYLFYLHGAIVQQQGANAVSEQYGAYEYTNIVNAFADLGYQVISEVRPKNSEIKEYSLKIVAEINELLNKGVPDENIVIVGASMGGYIAIEVAYQLDNKALHYAVLGLCSDYAFEYFADRKESPCGKFYSIYETSDQPGSCRQLLDNSNCSAGFEELALNMGNGHGFLYKPYPDWINPLSKWINDN